MTRRTQNAPSEPSPSSPPPSRPAPPPSRPAPGTRRLTAPRRRDVLRRLWAGRDNMLALWPPDAYEFRIYQRRLLWQEIVVVSQPEAVRQVLSSNARNYRKSTYTRRVLEPLVGDGMFISEGELWARQRRIATPAFHRSRLRRFAEDMVRAGERMVGRWDALPAGESLSLGPEMSRVTMEVVASTMFGDALTPAQTTTVFDAFTRYQDTLGKLDLAELCGLPAWLPPLGSRAARRAVKDMDAVMNAIIARRSVGDGHEDLLQLFMDSTDPETGRRMTPKLLRDETAVMVLAGHETTANTLVWAFWLLSQHPGAERKLHAELDTVLAGRTPCYDDLPALPFARAIIDETLRLYPPVHIFSREAQEADQIGKFSVSPGAMVVISPWLIHRHRRLWARADEFVPERFVEGAPESVQASPASGSGAMSGPAMRPASQFAYIPFGAGPRTCLGKHFGLAEATLLLVMAAQKYRLTPAGTAPAEPVGRLTIRPRGNLEMRLERRD